MISVSRNSWHTRVYRWWYAKKYGSEHCYGTTNLCPYMRAVLFWSWMRFLFIGGKIGRVRIPAVLWPSVLATLPLLIGCAVGAQFWSIVHAYGAIVFVSGFTAGTVGLLWFLEKRGFPAIGKAARAATATSFVHLTTEYLRSAHDRVCPEVEIK